MATNLHHLPVELLNIICTSLCHHCQGKDDSRSRSLSTFHHRHTFLDESVQHGFKALRSLCLVNRRLRDVAQPILYHHLSPFYWDWTQRRSPLLLPFLRTIGQNPQLAGNTRELDMRSILPHESKDYRLPALLSSLASSFPGHQDHIQSQHSHSEAEHENALVEMLLCALPNLETACLGISAGWTFPIMAAAAGENGDPGRSALWLSLKAVSLVVGAAITGSPSVFSGIGSILANAPHLQDLRLEGELLVCGGGLPRTLRRLELHSVRMSCSDLARMLQDCTALEEFHSFGTSSSSSSLSSDSSSADMGTFGEAMVAALAPASQSLQCLRVSHLDHVPCIKNTRPGGMPSLKHFAKLARIHLSTGLGPAAAAVAPRRPQYWAFGQQSFADMLPDSVRVFCPPCWPESILALAASVERCEFPALERVELEHGLQGFGDFARSKCWKKRRADLASALTAVGVDVCFAQDGEALPLVQWHTGG